MDWTQGTVGRVFFVRFDHGENIYAALTEFVRKQNIRTGVVQCMGAVHKVQCVAGPKEDTVPPKPDWQTVDSAHEVVGMATIAWNGEKPHIHMHAALGRGADAMVGCLRGTGEVFLVIEAIIFEFQGMTVARTEDTSLGIHKVVFETE